MKQTSIKLAALLCKILRIRANFDALRLLYGFLSGAKYSSCYNASTKRKKSMKHRVIAWTFRRIKAKEPRSMIEILTYWWC
jgi:hypothetical protein